MSRPDLHVAILPGNDIVKTTQGVAETVPYLRNLIEQSKSSRPAPSSVESSTDDVVKIALHGVRKDTVQHAFGLLGDDNHKMVHHLPLSPEDIDDIVRLFTRFGVPVPHALSMYIIGSLSALSTVDVVVSFIDAIMRNADILMADDKAVYYIRDIVKMINLMNMVMVDADITDKSVFGAINLIMMRSDDPSMFIKHFINKYDCFKDHISREMMTNIIIKHAISKADEQCWDWLADTTFALDKDLTSAIKELATIRINSRVLVRVIHREKENKKRPRPAADEKASGGRGRAAARRIAPAETESNDAAMADGS